MHPGLQGTVIGYMAVLSTSWLQDGRTGWVERKDKVAALAVLDGTFGVAQGFESDIEGLGLSTRPLFAP